MCRVWKILLVLVFATVGWAYLFTGPPRFGRRLKLKNVPIASIEISMMTTRREITESNLCAEVIQTMGHARDGGPVHECPRLGALTLHYTDGTTNCFSFMPGHRINRLDLVDKSGMYSISMGEMFATLERVGLLTKNHR